jgi:hypothetical protein
MSTDRMIGDWWIVKDLEGTGGDLIQVLSVHFPEGT